MFDRKRSRTVAVSLTVAEGTLGSLIGGAKSSGLGHQFKKIKQLAPGSSRSRPPRLIVRERLWLTTPPSDIGSCEVLSFVFERLIARIEIIPDAANAPRALYHLIFVQVSPWQMNATHPFRFKALGPCMVTTPV